MAARRIFFAALLPVVILTYAACSGGEGVPPGFELGLGNETKTGGFGGGNTSAPGPTFGPVSGGGGSGGDGGVTDEIGGGDARSDTTPPRDTAVAFDTAGFDTTGLDLGF